MITSLSIELPLDKLPSEKRNLIETFYKKNVNPNFSFLKEDRLHLNFNLSYLEERDGLFIEEIVLLLGEPGDLDSLETILKYLLNEYIPGVFTALEHISQIVGKIDLLLHPTPEEVPHEKAP